MSENASHLGAIGDAAIEDSIFVRSFRAADREQVAQLHRTKGGEDCICCECALSFEEIEDNYLGRPQDHFWVAEIRDAGHERIVGTVAMHVEKDEVAHLHCLHISPEMGDHQAIRRRLVQIAAAHARNHGSLKLVLHANVVAERAAAFLHRLGFEFSRHREGGAALEFYLNLYQRPELGEQGVLALPS